MRVIGGIYKRKPLSAPKSNARPTSDKIKETMFDIISNYTDIDGADIVDLFSGSGALGIECLSLGATTAVFVDIERTATETVKKNLSYLGIKEGAEVYRTDFRTALKKLDGRTFDIIFVDPPYGFNLENDAIKLIEQYQLLKKGGVIVVEQGSGTPLDTASFCVDERKKGNIKLTFLSFCKEDGHNE